MFIIEQITNVVEKTNTIHSDGNEVRKTLAEVKKMIDSESFKILQKSGIVVANGMLIRKA
jgi:hypothetical protein